jgi:hypothetical protein
MPIEVQQKPCAAAREGNSCPWGWIGGAAQAAHDEAAFLEEKALR